MKNRLRLAFIILIACSTLAVAQNTRYVLKIQPSDTPASPLIIAPGETVQFTAKAYEATSGGLTEVQISTLAWSVDPAAFGTIDANGSFTAATQNSTARGQIIATATVGSVTIRGTVAAMLGHQQGEFTFTGTVSSTQGPITGAKVSVMSVGVLPFLVTSYSDVQGNYSIKVPGGEYVVRAEAQGFVAEYYDNVVDPSQATKFVTDPNQKTISGINFLLGQGGSISGTVLDAVTNQPLQDVAVHAFTSGTSSGNPNGAGAYAITDAQGTFHITGLAPGDYFLQARKDHYSDQYFDGVTDLTLATKVAVADGQESKNNDFSLNKLPGLTGRVTNAVTGTPIERAIVVLDGPNSRAFAYTDAHGDYHLATQPGSYNVHCSAQGFVPEWYDDVTDIAQATAVTVPQTGSVTGIDFALDTYGGSIAGTVKDAAGSPIANATVSLWGHRNPTTTNAGGHFGKAVTAADGSYMISGLPPDDFIVRAVAQDFLSEFYDDESDIANADEVTVSNQPVTGIDFTLDRGGSISGKITDEDSGDPLSHAVVFVRSLTHRFERATRSDAHGVYTVHALPSDDYSVYATAPGHAGEYYNPTAAGPGKVTVTAPGAVTGIDFSLAAVTTGPRRFTGMIAGRGTGQPQNVLVEAINPETGAIITTTTDTRGAFSFNAWDNAIVRARALDYVGMYAGNTMRWEESRWSGFAGGMTITLDPVTAQGMAEIRGIVTEDGSGNPITDAWVYGIDAAGQVYFSVTGSDGGYLLENTPNGSLDIMVSQVLYKTTQGQADVENARGTADISTQRSTISAVDDDPPLPAAVRLHQNYPNPFNPSTTLRFDLPERMELSLKVYNLLGQEVVTLIDGIRDAGSHVIDFNADGMPSGLYLYRLQADGRTFMRRMTLMK